MAPPEDPYARRLAVEAARWSPGAKAASSHTSWLSLRTVQAQVNRAATGDPAVDWGTAVATRVLADRPRDGRALVLGCSDGAAERLLLRYGLCTEVDAVDLAPAAVAEARRRAEALDLPVNYTVADVNTFAIGPGRYTLCVVVMALHHFERLEEVLDRIAAGLRPDGLLVFDEFVGPTRFQWTDAQLALANEALLRVPEPLRTLPGGEIVRRVDRPELAFMERTEPFEAIRSAEVLPLVLERFELLFERPYGGALLHPTLARIAPNFDEADPTHLAVLADLIEFEAAARTAGRIGDDFTVVVARPMSTVAP